MTKFFLYAFWPLFLLGYVAGHAWHMFRAGLLDAEKELKRFLDEQD